MQVWIIIDLVQTARRVPDGMNRRQQVRGQWFGRGREEGDVSSLSVQRTRRCLFLDDGAHGVGLRSGGDVQNHKPCGCDPLMLCVGGDML